MGNIQDVFERNQISMFSGDKYRVCLTDNSERDASQYGTPYQRTHTLEGWLIVEAINDHGDTLAFIQARG